MWVSPELLAWLGEEAASRGLPTSGRGRVLREVVDQDRADPAELEDPGQGPNGAPFFYALTEPQGAHLTARAEEEGLSVAATLRAILEARRG